MHVTISYLQIERLGFFIGMSTLMLFDKGSKKKASWNCDQTWVNLDCMETNKSTSKCFVLRQNAFNSKI